MYVLFYSGFGGRVYDIFCFYLFAGFVCFGGVMVIYNLVLAFVVLEIIYELIELIFPIKKMRSAVKSFVLLVMLTALCSYIFSLF